MSKNVDFQDLYSLVDERTNQIMYRFDKLETRVSKLESFKGQVILVGSLFVLFSSLFIDWMKKQFNI